MPSVEPLGSSTGSAPRYRGASTYAQCDTGGVTPATQADANQTNASQPDTSQAVHDLGGTLGFSGPVPHEFDEPPFHHDWERQVFALFGPALAVSATRSGEFRYGLERLAATDYFDHGYYGRWLAGLELLLTEYGVLGPDEIDRRLGADLCTGPVRRSKPVADVDPGLLPASPASSTTASDERRQHTTQRVLSRPPRFSVGDAVIAKTSRTPGHTRLPAYAQNKHGVVAQLHSTEVLPDSTAHDLGERPQHVYAVGFDASELWGPGAEAGVTVHVDMYECYLTTAQEATP